MSGCYPRLELGPADHVNEIYYELEKKINYLYNGIEKVFERIERIEEILKDYLKPNTRDDLDRLEQRFRIIELKLRDLNVRID